MSYRGGRRFRRGWLVLAIVSACSSDDASGDGNDSSSTDPSTSGAGLDSSDDAGSSSTGAPACPPAGGASVVLSHDVALPEGTSGESDVVDTVGTCMVVTGSGDASSGWQLELDCEFDDGLPAQTVHLSLTVPDAPFSTLVPSEPVELRLHRWWGFEVGAGTQLALAQGGTTHLIAYDESAGGGLVGICVPLDEGIPAGANAWLAAMAARVEAGACGDGETLRLARTAAGVDAFVYPGEIGPLGDDVHGLVEAAACAIAESGTESWSLKLALWRE